MDTMVDMTNMKLVRMHEKSPDNILNSEYLVKEKIEPREYQLTIANNCLNRNSLVIIPTGLGKTIIAAILTAKTFELYPSDHKIILMAPTKPLITQHAQNFHKFIRFPQGQKNDSDETILTGSISPEARQEIYEGNKLLFYTPQTLRNDLLQERYDLKDVCMIIYDEAHRASGNYAYCDIARIYKEVNPDGKTLGLTASPGSNKEKIETLCRNLNIPSGNIELRTRNDQDVRPYLHRMEIESIGVKMNSLMHEILRDLNSLYKEKLGSLIRLGILDEKGWNINRISRKNLIEINRNILTKINNKKRQPYGDNRNLYKALSINAEAMRLGHMISVVEGQGLDVLMEYFDKIHKESQKSNASKAVRNLVHHPLMHRTKKSLLSAKNIDPELLIHPKYFKLRDLLEKQLHDNPNSKILVFAKLRDTVRQMTSNLEKIDGIRPVRFVGQSSKGKKDKGLSQKNQVKIIEQFKQGTHNVLVSTNVAEEGLDIAECDLVVFYDTVASEIRLIQRRGRTARERDGRVIILYCKDTSDEIYLHIALQRLKRMRETLKKKTQHPKNHKLTSFIKENHKGRNKTENGFEARHKRATCKKQKDKPDNSNRRKPESSNTAIRLNKEIPSHYGIREALNQQGIESMTLDMSSFDGIRLEIFKPALSIGHKLAMLFLKRKHLEFLIDLYNANAPERSLIIQDLAELRERFEVLVFFLLDDTQNSRYEVPKREAIDKVRKQWEVISRSEIIQIRSTNELNDLISKIVDNVMEDPR